MLRRTSFAQKPFVSRVRVKEWDGPTPTPRAPVRAVVAMDRALVVVPKENALQHSGYQAAVRTLACRRCGWYRKGSIQFCHSDEGKGGMLKTDCRRGWAGCGPHDGQPGCHWFVGTSGRMGKAGRREFESFAAASTRAEIEARGLWPKRLARWPG